MISCMYACASVKIACPNRAREHLAYAVLTSSYAIFESKVRHANSIITALCVEIFVDNRTGLLTFARAFFSLSVEGSGESCSSSPIANAFSHMSGVRFLSIEKYKSAHLFAWGKEGEEEIDNTHTHILSRTQHDAR